LAELSDLADAREAILEGLRNGILPFWRERAIDAEHGGYYTEFDANGERAPGPNEKLIVTQTRLVWCFSTFASVADDRDAVLALARHGVDCLADQFWDDVHGGFRWKVSRSGEPLDDGKLVFGQEFALYALSAYARATGEERARQLAEWTFDLLQRNAADTARGGYYENLEADWTPAGGGSAAGDRKSLDIHMHLLEAFTDLLLLTDDPIHAQRLREVRSLICDRMVDPDTGAGGHQYSLDFRPIAPITIDRTWIAERPGSEERDPPPDDLTSFGHNLELAWLLAEADEALGEPAASDETIAALATHALDHGYDTVNGGVFREGTAKGDVTDRDKEFWQNSEALVGFLEGYRVTQDDAFLDAFLGTWRFAKTHMVHPTFGEWCVRTTETGDVVVGDLGNPWKNAYHTGRAALESARRIDAIVGR
jgi:mannobiose 2-epimerase